MKQYLTLLFSALLATGASAQSQAGMDVHLNGSPACGFDKVLQKAQVPYSTLIEAYHSNTSRHSPASKGTGVVYDIPVVFHIIYGPNQTAFNIPDSVIANQVAVLNAAYRNRHADTANTRAMFKPLAGDAEIQFHLASVDPQGAATTGITRTQSTRRYFGSPTGSLDSLEHIKKTSAGGKDPWPTTRYLNIWVANMSDSNGSLNILGYGIPPLNPVPSNWPAGTGAGLAGLTDGVVLQTHTVGSNSALNAQLMGIYTKGRAAVHEVGHYLGLQHVFGANNGGGSGGSCGAIADDGISDTPEQSTMSFDNNSGTSCPPSSKNSCGAGTTGDLPDMWENYMDYSRDACQTLFTQGQIAVIRSVLANQRNTLVSTTAVGNVPERKTVTVYPNPAGNTLSVQFDGKVDRITVLNFMGQKAIEWSGASTTGRTFDISQLPAGNYLLVLDAADERTATRFVIAR